MTATVTLNKNRILELLKNDKLKEIFTQHLGWNNFNQTMPVQVEGKIYSLNGIVQKEGFAIYEYVNNSSEPIKSDLRKKISNKLAKTQLEHLIVFTERNKEQVWQWIKRATTNSPAATRSIDYNPVQSGEKLYQKLEKLFFDWDDYTITDVTSRVNETLNKDKVTKKFYDEFKKNKDNFSKFIEGMTENIDKEWYSSLMMNRLMFVYFIQKKRFLNNDENYMRNKLNEIKARHGNNKFYSFYREFLLVLFQEGFAKELNKRSEDTMQIIGKIPYLNGGLFDLHELERKYPEINIPDSAFEKIFDFFDKYDWHLDDRPISDDKQINPDVIGYIFEKYINQKQMGAYYTKEDITEYIGKNTIIPFLFEKAKEKCEVAFKENSYIWQMLKDNPDKYIYDAVKKGCDKPLPEYIEKGINNVSQREKWNTPASEEYALPTEIWRETVERRNRYFEVKSKLENGEINSINDFITYNLDIRQFVEDVITNAESSDVVKAFYYTIAGHIGEKSNEKDIPAMSILDPTCGSGAFLFAALNILEPLYDACIDKMYDLKHDKPDSYKEFDSILADIEKHPNREYFIYKSIILNNLYGVDIMKEATEIAKLRLFLKLASCAELDYRKDNYGLEALPDIDFNIRSGNSLVGFANYNEVKFAVECNNLNGQMNLLSGNAMDIIDDKAQMVSTAYNRFRNAQVVECSHEELISAKKELQTRLAALNDELNHYMAKKYRIDVENHPQDYKKWLSTHEPFNWFVEFYDVIHNRGGFDVIIGNPPYVEYSKVKTYKIKNYQTEECGNLYAYIIENCFKLLKEQNFISMIIPLSGFSTDRMNELKNLLCENSSNWISFYSGDANPSILFKGVKMRLAIFINRKHCGNSIYTTKYKRWYSTERDFLFTNIQYVLNSNSNSVLKFFSDIENSIYAKIRNNATACSLFVNNSNYCTYYHNTPIYWTKSFLSEDSFCSPLQGIKKSAQYKTLKLLNTNNQNLINAVMNSTLFYWWWIIYSDCYHITNREIYNLPIISNNSIDTNMLSQLNIELTEDLINKSTVEEYNYQATGKVKFKRFFPQKSKLIIDKIDKIIGSYLNLDDKELDFIINYDIKYRMSTSLNNGGNDDEE